MSYRVLTLILKELRAILRDRQGRVLLIAPVILQLAVFAFAATIEVKNNTLGVFNEDMGAESAELLHRLGRAQAFTKVGYLYSEADVRRAVDRQHALLVLRFSPDFSRNIAAGRPARIQAVLDGRRSNNAQIALGYVHELLQSLWPLLVISSITLTAADWMFRQRLG
ncbi:MAG TPA: hypothetical protein P5555_06585 [Candidatus Paceibacterota bacterium]|nr:hypothetical protein [Verrucomicrobiota bacterium]HOX01985.1 hypothetical protein [Verrucomicrobiota bacterium]HRZ44840.1 hypothetical protein [Candidatus Paceibacterota bacterium]HRZ94645.1 hypothetical protein [Candidatus Paceibacterota bacterium]